MIPVLLLVFMGILDFGRLIYAYNALSNAARDGARTAIVDQGSTGGIEHAATAAVDQAATLGIDPVADVDVVYTEPVASGACPTRAIGCIATVTVREEFRAITPIIGNFIGAIDLEAETSMVIEATKP